MDSSEVLQRALGFAEERLGPASSAYLRAPEARAPLQTRLKAGQNIEDATLAVLFRRVPKDRRLADEFFAYFFGEISANGSTVVTPALRELMETGELVDSVVRDVWKDLGRFEFRTRGQFLAFLLRRMKWKRINSLRTAQRKTLGGEMLPVTESKIHLFPDADSRSPQSEFEHEEDLRRVAKLSAGLAKPDREMLLMRIIDGHSYAEVGERFGISPKAAKGRIRVLMACLRERF